MKNLKEFKALIERYETITLEEIDRYFYVVESDVSNVSKELTGFGSYFTCSLCLSVIIDKFSKIPKPDCNLCVYVSVEYFGNLGNVNNCTKHPTYSNIKEATDPEELLNAYRERAKYMKTLIKDL
jgi:hypothetical protein